MRLRRETAKPSLSLRQTLEPLVGGLVPTVSGLKGCRIKLRSSVRREGGDLVEYRVLGPIEVANNGDGAASVGGPLMRRLLAILVLHADRVVPVDQLIEAVWGDRPPVAAEATLQTYVSRLRRAVGDERRIVSRSPGYVLVTDGDSIDSRRFEMALADGRAALVGGDEERAVALLSDGLRLWRGRALLEFADEPWAQIDARRLDEQRLVALEELAAARLAVSPPNDVVPDLERLVAEHPLRERPLALLMTALYRGGRHAEALRVFQDHRDVLGEELGLEPSTELRLLERQILDQDPSLAKASTGRALRGYRLIEPFRGGDGSGETWLAVQPSVGREVVIKMIPATVANDPQFIRRFEAEAQVVAGLEHPHIVPIYDYWREAGGAYVVMRYLRGGSLASTLLSRRSTTDALTIVGQVADALAEAHRRGVAHGDLQARDVLLDATGAAYVSDFAIGGASDDRPSMDGDLRSLGLLLAELLAAPLPFDRNLDPVDQLGRIRPDLSGPALDIVARATRPNDDQHFASSAELSEACDSARPADPRGRRATTSKTDRNPYKGLRSFEESDAADFFGRDALLDDLLDRLRDGARFVAVIGPSGSGKSSLVRAGLLPAVRRGAIDGSATWFVTSMTPGDNPLAELAMAIGRVAVRPVSELREVLGSAGGFGRAVRAALPDDGSELVLVVDQLEEIFTVCHDEESRKAFLDGLAHAAFDGRSRLRIVTTLRADFYDRPLQYRAFAELLDARSLTVVPPGPADLEAAIIGPAARAGVELESGLLSHLVNDLSERPAALALLQFTMAELFDQRRAGMLTFDACRAIGGVTGALAHRADLTFDALTPEQQQVVRRVFCRLVVISESGIESGRRVAVDQLSPVDDQAMVAGVVDRFAEQRLLTFDRDPITRAPTVEIAHEALITAWPRLSNWIDEDRDALRVRREVELASRHWRTSGGDDSDLYRGVRLAAAIEWSHEHPEMLGEIEREFVAASKVLDEREVAQARRSSRRLRRRLAFAAVAIIVAVVAGAVAIVQRRNLDNQRRLTAQNAQLAEQQRTLAEQQGVVAEQQRTLAAEQQSSADAQRTIADKQRRLADARRLMARAATTADRSLAVLLSLEANVLNPSTEAHSAIASTLADRPLVTPIRLATAEGVYIASSYDDKVFIQSDSATDRVAIFRLEDDGTWSPPQGGLLATTHPGVVTAAFDREGRRVAVLGGDNVMRMFDVRDPASPKVIGEPVVVPGQAISELLFNDDGSLIAASGSAGATVYQVVADQPIMLTTVSGCAVPGCSATSVFGLAFSPTEPSVLVVKPLIGPARMVNLETGSARSLEVEGVSLPCCYGVTFTPDGRWLAVTMGSAGVAIFDPTTGSLIRTLAVPADLTMWAAFDIDGSRLLAGDVAGNVTIWETSSWRQILSVQAGIGGTSYGGFIAGTGRVALIGRSLVSLDLESPPLLERSFSVDLVGMTAALPGQNGSLLVAHQNGVSVVDGSSGAVLKSVEGGSATALAVGPDAGTIVVGRADGRIQLLDAETLVTRVELGTLEAPIDAVATRGGAEPLIAAVTDRLLKIWSIGSGTPQLILTRDFGPSIGIRAGIAFTHDGAELAANFYGGMAVIDLATLDVRPAEPPSAGTGGVTVADPLGRDLYLAALGPTTALVDGDLAVDSSMPDTAAGVVAAAFSPDGSFAATGGFDGTIALLDVDSRAQYGSIIRTPFGQTSWLFFLPESSTMVTIHSGINDVSRIAYWNLDPAFLINKACEVAGRDLTDAEWDTYLPGYPHSRVCA